MKFLKMALFAAGVVALGSAEAQEKSVDLSYSSPVLVQKGVVEITLADFGAYLDRRVPTKDHRALLASPSRIEAILENIALTEAFFIRAQERGMMEDPFFRARLYQAAAREARDVYRANLQAEIELDSYETQAREMYLIEPKRFSRAQSVDMEHILISVTEEGGEVEAMKRIIDAHERLMAGEAFTEVAEVFSDDPTFPDNQGLLANLEVGSLVPSVASAVDSLALNEYSPPIQSRFGWHIVRVKKINDAGQMTWEEAQPIAEGLARNKHLAESFERILREIGAAPMQFKPGAVQAILDHYGIESLGAPDLSQADASEASE